MTSDLYASSVAPTDDDLSFKLVGGLAASCFIGALVCDIVYWISPNFMWVTFSVWLITIGLVVAAVATVIGLIDRAMHRRLATIGAVWPYLLGFAAVIVVSVFNAFVHSRDAYEAVVPAGLALSVVAVALLVLTPVFARAIARNHPRKGSL